MLSALNSMRVKKLRNRNNLEKQNKNTYDQIKFNNSFIAVNWPNLKKTLVLL